MASRFELEPAVGLGGPRMPSALGSSGPSVGVLPAAPATRWVAPDAVLGAVGVKWRLRAKLSWRFTLPPLM